ncbi:MAG: hypothetical protein MJ025_03130, partial [Victivallaceae bacterium]|nr:hypothetical protein [Victivallaceae bacterium]
MLDGKFPWLSDVAERLDASYGDGIGVNTMLDNLPRSEEVVSLTRDLLETIFPGFVLDDGLDMPARLERIAARLLDQVRRAMRRGAGGRAADGCGGRRGCGRRCRWPGRGAGAAAL